MATQKPFKRIRHDLKFRVCEVVRKTYITPKMIRIDVFSPDLTGFTSLAFDDHVKLFFATGTQPIEAPVAGPNGLMFPLHLPQPAGRDFTPRNFDPETNILTLDFVAHDAGPATNWATKAKPGDTVGVGGPRASFVLQRHFDWYLLMGDETALPAISRFVAEAKRTAKISAIIEVDAPEEIQEISSKANLDLTWAVRSQSNQPAALLLQHAKSFSAPRGDGFIFIAGEADKAKQVRNHFIKECDHNPDWVKAAGYWRLNDAAFYDGHEH